MKREIDSRLVALIAMVGVLLLVGVGTWVWTRPAASTVTAAAAGPPGGAGGAGGPVGTGRTREMRDSHKTTDEDRRAFEEWRRNNPNATTKFRP